MEVSGGILSGKQRLVQFIKETVKEELDQVKEEQNQFREKMKSFVQEHLNLMSIIIRHHECITQLYKRQNQLRKHLSSLPSSRVSKKSINYTKQIEELILTEPETPSEAQKQESFDQILGAVKDLVGCCQDKTQNVVVNMDLNNNPVFDTEPTLTLPPISSMKLWAQTKSNTMMHSVMAEDQSNAFRKSEFPTISTTRFLHRNRSPTNSIKQPNNGNKVKGFKYFEKRKTYKTKSCQTQVHSGTSETRFSFRAKPPLNTVSKRHPVLHKNTLVKRPTVKTTQTFLVGPPACEKQPFMSTKGLKSFTPVQQSMAKNIGNPFPFSLFHSFKSKNSSFASSRNNNNNNNNANDHDEKSTSSIPSQNFTHSEGGGAGEKQDNFSTPTSNFTNSLSFNPNHNVNDATTKISPPVIFPSYDELMTGKLPNEFFYQQGKRS